MKMFSIWAKELDLKLLSRKILEEDDAHDANSWIGGYCLMRA